MEGKSKRLTHPFFSSANYEFCKVVKVYFKIKRFNTTGIRSKPGHSDVLERYSTWIWAFNYRLNKIFV